MAEHETQDLLSQLSQVGVLTGYWERSQDKDGSTEPESCGRLDQEGIPSRYREMSGQPLPFVKPEESSVHQGKGQTASSSTFARSGTHSS